MSHDEFVAAYRDGRIRVQVDRTAAARLMSQRLLLPFVLLPLFGLAVALALTGAWVKGAALFVLVVVFRYAVRASGQGFVLSRALTSADFYRDARATGVLRVEDAG